MAKKVFVSGCYDMLHSGHVAFFKEAASYGDLYVGIGSDKTIQELKQRKTIYSENERLYMVRAIRYVTDARINGGSGLMDFVDSVDLFRPDIFVVNEDGSTAEKAEFCRERGIEYVVLRREPETGLEARSTTSLRKVKSQLPTRLDIAGTWIDQPYVSRYAPGWAITMSLEPTFEIEERCGLSTSTRNAIKKIWPYQLPCYDPEKLAKLVFCFENEPSNSGHVSGAQDAIGICIPGLCRHYYDHEYWPVKIETCYDEKILTWLESHVCMVKTFPRVAGCDVLAGSDINTEGVKALAAAAAQCWDDIMQCDLQGFAKSVTASFHAQVKMFPSMIQPGVSDYIDRYLSDNNVLALKLAGAGGGGYMGLVVDDIDAFMQNHPEAIRLTIRRKNSD